MDGKLFAKTWFRVAAKLGKNRPKNLGFQHEQSVYVQYVKLYTFYVRHVFHYTMARVRDVVATWPQYYRNISSYRYMKTHFLDKTVINIKTSEYWVPGQWRYKVFHST